MRKKERFKLGVHIGCMLCLSLFSNVVAGEEIVVASVEEETIDSETEMAVQVESLSEFNYEEDAQYMFMRIANEQLVARCEDGYYVRIEDVLYFADEELENVTPLCYRPECLHANGKTKVERAECEAYLGDPKYLPSISFSNGKLYTTSSFDLVNKDQFRDFVQKTFVLSADGLKKDIVDELPSGIQTSTVVHRGYYYYSYGINEALDSGDVKQLRIIARMPIDGGEEEVLYSSWESNIIVGSIIPYREYVYFDNLVDGKLCDYVYMLDSKEWKVMEPPVDDDLEYVYMIEGDHLLWRGARVANLEETGWENIWTSDLDGSNMRLAFSLTELENWDGEELIIDTDGTWIYRDTRPLAYGTDEDRMLLYYDRETLEYAGSVNLGNTMGWNVLTTGDDRYIFFMRYPEYPSTDKSQICYIRKDELETGEAEVQVLVEGEAYSHGWVSYGD